MPKVTDLAPSLRGSGPLGPLAPLLHADRDDDDTFSEILERPGSVVSVPEAGRAFVIAALAAAAIGRLLLVATPTQGEAERLAVDLEAFLGSDRVDVCPAWETLPLERVSPGIETMGRRVRTMWHLRSWGSGRSQGSGSGKASGSGRPSSPERSSAPPRPATPRPAAPRVVVAPIRSLLQRLGPHVEDTAPVVVSKGDSVDLGELVGRLVGLGYRREYQVEHRGEVAVRGSIIDVFGSTADVPVRIDLWGDEVDRLSEFSVGDQRSTVDVESVELFACRELRPSDEIRARARGLVRDAPWGAAQLERLGEGHFFDGMESWLGWLADDEHLLADLLPDDSVVVLVDPRRMRDRATDLVAEEDSLVSALANTWGVDHEGLPRLHLPFDRLLARTSAPTWSVTSAPEGPDTEVIAASGWDPVVGGGERLVAQLRGFQAEGYRIAVCADGKASGARLAELLSNHGVAVTAGDPPGRRDDRLAHVVVTGFERGFFSRQFRVAVLAESDISGRRRTHRRPRPRARNSETFFDDLHSGSLVVHHQHGVGRFAGMVRRSIGGVERDYLLLEYKGGDKLYVPSDQVDLLRPYSGGESPTLNRLNGAEWQRTKSKVRSAVREIAQELVVLYQKRITSPGHAFGPDTPWQAEVEEAFPYQETPDQLTAIDEVKSDMERSSPMDRLVCGDVGFGKTEIALRAAFKAVQDGMQVAVLVPTTLLASQHYQTFSERFSGYPLRVEMLSRFLTAAQAKEVTDGLASGSVDVVIGTHKLLSGDVKFKALGLLVVDEEQRFGVHHKESIKKLRADVDVLTLTATPIPRTLEMSLTGIRDLTLLHTPPADRQPILTYVGEHDDRAVAEAIRRELLREGQVFYVHNRVADIDRVAADLRAMVPEARVATAHGQMDEGALEKVVLDFWEGSYDVLVCTTIIESGIDMPTVNTLVVDRADRLGLGQLHQLRGRVGRSGQRAYAYLFYPPDQVLSEEAYERLKTIGEHTELGSGFKIAMRDLEIRGAGNLLGGDQSGHIAAVGYDLYVQMVSEAVAELKGEPLREPAEIKLDVPVSANLPADYVSREDLRLEAYRRLATVTTQGEVDDIEKEWLDRFGPLPDPARALLHIAQLRAECARVGVRDVTVVASGAGMGGGYTARMSPLELKFSQTVRLGRLAAKAVYKQDIGQLVVPLSKSTDPVEHIRVLLSELFPPVASASP